MKAAKLATGALFYLLVAVIVVSAVFPFYYAILSSMKSGTDLHPIPGTAPTSSGPDLPAPYSNQHRIIHDDTTHITNRKQGRTPPHTEPDGASVAG